MKDTVEIVQPISVGNSLFGVYGLSDAGCVRKNNEDTIYFDCPESFRNNDYEDILLLIADGMGGHNAGEVASKLVVDHVRSVRTQFGNDLHKSLSKAFTEANRAVYRAAQRDSSLNGMGTTCTAVIVCKGYAYCAHVGDSRVYLLRDGAIYRMTEDHTVLAENRKNARAQAPVDDQEVESSLLTRAVGTYRSVTVDTWSHGLPIKHNDRFLLCTDGLTDLVNDNEINSIMMSFPLDEACYRMLELAKQRGGHDNISMIAVFATV